MVACIVHYTMQIVSTLLVAEPLLCWLQMRLAARREIGQMEGLPKGTTSKGKAANRKSTVVAREHATAVTEETPLAEKAAKLQFPAEIPFKVVDDKEAETASKSAKFTELFEQASLG